LAVVTVYQHGLKAGMAPGRSDHPRSKRRECQGWTQQATRSNVAFLRSVSLEELTGQGYCITLTVKTCPDSPEQWATWRDTYIKRLRRAGIIRMHWVTEWQRRGVPHLHGVVYFPDPENTRQIVLQTRLLTKAWLDVVDGDCVEQHSQHVAPIQDALGWLEYLAKHSARGADHYQRSKESMPVAWDGVSGRMWGRSGSWPTQPALRLSLCNEAYWRFRRLVRGYRRADARFASKAFRIVQARSMLKCNLRSLSECRGVSEWIPEKCQFLMFDWLRAQGLHVFA